MWKWGWTTWNWTWRGNTFSHQWLAQRLILTQRHKASQKCLLSNLNMSLTSTMDATCRSDVTGSGVVSNNPAAQSANITYCSPLDSTLPRLAQLLTKSSQRYSYASYNFCNRDFLFYYKVFKRTISLLWLYTLLICTSGITCVSFK